MARPLRIEYPGAWYHVTCRGNERSNIYRDDKDKRRFLKALGESAEAFKVEVHCYTLMSNHFHIILRTPGANLSRFMQRFNTAYITYYNLRHHRSGHLYQGRFKSVLIEADEYLLELSRYIHLNPVRLKRYQSSSVRKRAEILKSYEWSSLGGYIGLRSSNHFMHYQAVLGYMGGENRKGRERYRDYVLEGLSEEIENPLGRAKADAILGTDSFVSWLKKKFLDVKEWRSQDFSHIKTLQREIPVEEIAKVVGEEYGVEPREILRVRSQWREARQVLIEMSYLLNLGSKSLEESGKELGGIGAGALVHTHKRIQERMKKDKEISRRIERIYRHISQ
jgi:putative transposase